MKIKWRNFDEQQPLGTKTIRHLLINGSHSDMIDYAITELVMRCKSSIESLEVQYDSADGACAKGQALLGQMDLFGGGNNCKLFVIDQVKDKHFAHLDKLISNNTGPEIFLLCGPDLRSSAKWIKGWIPKDNCGVWSMYDPDYDCLRAGVHRIVKEHGYTMSMNDSGQLAKHYSDEIVQLHNFIQKVCLYYARDDIAQLTYEHCCFLMNRDDFEELLTNVIEALLDGNLQYIVHVQHLLVREEKIKTLRLLLYHMYRIWSVAVMMGNGDSFEQAVASLRPPVIFTQMPMMRRLLNRWSTKSIMRAISLLREQEKNVFRYGNIIQDDIVRMAMNITRIK